MKLLKNKLTLKINTKFIYDLIDSNKSSQQRSYEDPIIETDIEAITPNTLELNLSFVIDSTKDIKEQIQNALQLVEGDLIKDSINVNNKSQAIKKEEKEEYDKFQKSQKNLDEETTMGKMIQSIKNANKNRAEKDTKKFSNGKIIDKIISYGAYATIAAMAFIITENIYNQINKSNKTYEFIKQTSSKPQVISYNKNKQIIDSLSKENSSFFERIKDSISPQESILEKTVKKIVK